MSTPNDGVILKSPADWDAWNREFQAEAKRRSLLEQIKNSLPFLPEPVLPHPRDFPKQVQTRASSTVGAGTTSSTATHIMELSPEGRTMFQLALSFYQSEWEIYEEQQEDLEKLQNWMTKTVAMSYKRTCFGVQDILGWYQALKDQVGVDEYHIKRDIKDAYKRAVKPLSKPPKDFESWIANWEQIMAQGLERNLSFALNHDDWFEDFLSAVIQIDPTWTKAYRLTNEKGVREGTLSYHTLANDFRDVVRNLSSSSARSTRIAKPLKDQVGVDEYDIKRDIKEAYKRAVKPLSKPPKDFESWIANWEQIMAQGLQRNLSFAINHDDWFEDFLSAIIQIDPTWAIVYRLINEKKVREGTLSYRTLANDFRNVVRNLSSA